MHVTKEQRDAWSENTRNSPFNLWLRERATDSTGVLDLDRLRDVASEYGIDASKYAHLNPGQQRMNIGNRLRAVVPEHLYTATAAPITGSVAIAAVIDVVEEPALRWPSGGQRIRSNHTVADLMRLYGDVIDELRDRGVVRTGNAPLGDYAEHLFAKAFSWSLASNSASGHDATDAAGLRFQIKSRRLRSTSKSERQLSEIRSLPDAKFDMLAGVLFDRRFDVYRAALVPHAVVVQRAKFIPYLNAWRFMLDDDVWHVPGVRDVTAALSAAGSD